ncbi:hypothetical protein, partial [Actinacidiphila rubida]|uniref:hypothetical protein n=1 Tax=Actinacidiphila rubida TaxID=310780 RepID=UPI00210E07D5
MACTSGFVVTARVGAAVVRVGEGAAERVAVRPGLAEGLAVGVCAVPAEGEPAVVVVAPDVG